MIFKNKINDIKAASESRPYNMIILYPKPTFELLVSSLLWKVIFSES